MPKLYYADVKFGLPKGFRMRGYDESDVLALIKDPKQLVRLAEIANLYCQQKGGLVWGRAELSEIIAEKFKFPRKTKTAKVDGKDTEVDDDTDVAHMERFVEAVVAGDAKLPGFTPSGSDAPAKEVSVWTELQKYADQCGDVTAAGEDCYDAEGKAIAGRVPHAYQLDITRAEPKARKAKGPSKSALEAAEKVIAKGAENVAAFKARYAKGYTDPNGIAITPITHDPFDTVAPKGAKAEEIEAVKQSNLRALALAIDAKEAQVRAFYASKAKGEYA